MRSPLLLIFLFYGFSISAQMRLIADSQKISRLNTPTQAEAYPFLSNDGLRLYYSNSVEGRARVYISERKSVNDNFEVSKPLSKNLPDSLFGATLTGDELEIYLFDAWKPFYAKRAKIGEEFSIPVLIKELGDCHRSPAISPKGDELIAIHDSGCDSTRKSNDTIRLFIKDNQGIFQRSGVLSYPEGFRPGPGQFSKDGLSYFMSVNKRWYDYEKEWQDSTISLKFTRTSLRSLFTKSEIVFSELPHDKPQQITFNQSETIMIGVRTTVMEWRKNDLLYFTVVDSTLTTNVKKNKSRKQ